MQLFNNNSNHPKAYKGRVESVTKSSTDFRVQHQTMENELQRLLHENASLKERNLVLESLPESAKVPPKAPLLNVPAMNTPMMTPPTYQVPPMQPQMMYQPQQQMSFRPQYTPRQPPQCYGCGQVGHMHRDCPKKSPPRKGIPIVKPDNTTTTVTLNATSNTTLNATSNDID